MTSHMGFDSREELEEFRALAQSLGAGEFDSDLDWVARTAVRLGIGDFDTESRDYIDDVAKIAGLVWFERAFEEILNDGDPDEVEVESLTNAELVEPFEFGAWAERNGYDVLWSSECYRDEISLAVSEVSKEIASDYGRKIASDLCSKIGETGLLMAEMVHRKNPRHAVVEEEGHDPDAFDELVEGYVNSDITFDKVDKYAKVEEFFRI